MHLARKPKQITIVPQLMKMQQKKRLHHNRKITQILRMKMHSLLKIKNLCQKQIKQNKKVQKKHQQKVSNLQIHLQQQILKTQQQRINNLRIQLKNNLQLNNSKHNLKNPQLQHLLKKKQQILKM